MDTREINIIMPSKVNYVTGSINDIAATWTNIEGDIWRAYTKRNLADMYRVSLYMRDAAGNANEASMTLYYMPAILITDRTQKDVDYAMRLAATGRYKLTGYEATDWDNYLKGTYNAWDFNRVGKVMNWLVARYNAWGYNLKVEEARTNWIVEEDVTEAKCNFYLDLVRFLRSLFPMYPDTPQVPADMIFFNYREANDIEKILEDIIAMSADIANSWYFSGELFSGEV